MGNENWEWRNFPSVYIPLGGGKMFYAFSGSVRPFNSQGAKIKSKARFKSLFQDVQDEFLCLILLNDNKVVHLHKITIMAITIKNIPVLEGTTAEDFVRSADKNATKATPRLSASAKKQLQKVLEKSRSFRFN